MGSCKDCMHEKVCDYFEGDLNEEGAENCVYFKDRNKFVELPCKIGDTVYGIDYPRGDIKVVVPEEVTGIAIETNCDFYKLTDFGKTVFLTREEAERALNSSENPNG